MYTASDYWRDRARAWKPVRRSFVQVSTSFKKRQFVRFFWYATLTLIRYSWFLVALAFFKTRRSFERSSE